MNITFFPQDPKITIPEHIEHCQEKVEQFKKIKDPTLENNMQFGLNAGRLDVLKEKMKFNPVELATQLRKLAPNENSLPVQAIMFGRILGRFNETIDLKVILWKSLNKKNPSTSIAEILSALNY